MSGGHDATGRGPDESGGHGSSGGDMDERGGHRNTGGSGEAGGASPSATSQARLEELRARILELDEELIRLVGERRDRVLEVGRLKGALGLPVLDPGREAQVVRRAAERARALGVDEEMVRDVVWRIIASARDAQEGRTSWGPPPITEPDAPPPASPDGPPPTSDPEG